MKKQQENNEEKELVVEPVKKSKYNWIIYSSIGALCLLFVLLTCFNKPQAFITNNIRYLFGLIIMIYAAIFLLPFAFKKKENAYINLLTIIELATVGAIALSLFSHEETEYWNISRAVGLTVYIFGVVEVVRGYHSKGGVKLYKNPIMNGFIKYFNIALITLGTYLFFVQPFSGDKIIIFVRIVLCILGVAGILIGIISKPTNEKKVKKEKKK